MNDWRLETAAAGPGHHPDPVRPDPIRAEYVREGPALFWLALGQACLTVLTLGLYRFWMTTRLRRYYWSAIRLQGDPFEYTGTGIEKLIGFLVALTILAVYLSIVNIAFVFGGLISADDVLGLELAINLSILASLPLIYFATYRAKRYIMARTRWRGIRFGMEQAAWAYAGRAVLLTLLTVITLGILYPFQNFRLTRFVTDRTWFGDLKFDQGGRWTALLGAWAWVYPGILMTIGAFVLIALDPEDEGMVAAAALLLMTGYFAIYLAMLRYRVVAFRYFWRHRTLAGARFRNGVDTGEVIGVTLCGSMAVWTAALFVAFGAMVVAAVFWAALVGEDRFTEILDQIEARRTDGKVAWQLLAVIATGYLAAIPVAIAFNHIFMTRPILRRQVEGMQIADAHVLATAQQRGHDHALEAGGFADALGVDIGSGF